MCIYNLIYRSVSVNVKAILNVSQVLAKKMIENNIKGSIVNISSQASKVFFFILSIIKNELIQTYNLKETHEWIKIKRIRFFPRLIVLSYNRYQQLFYRLYTYVYSSYMLYSLILYSYIFDEGLYWKNLMKISMTHKLIKAKLILYIFIAFALKTISRILL